MRIALGIAYQGSDYHGWQAQSGLQTIQATLENAIAKVANHPITLSCAGRTDKGVHALGQVAHFDSHAQRTTKAWLLGINTYLPKDIRIHWAINLTDEFHARFSALARRYQYVIDNTPLASALWHQHTTHYHYPLDEKRMQQAASYLMGEHDFSAFRASSCQSKTAIREVQQLRIYRVKQYVIIDITANAFLHHMVRNIVAVLMQIGVSKRAPEWAQEVLLSQDRKKGGITAQPQGLYLVEIFYPVKYSLEKPTETILSFLI